MRKYMPVTDLCAREIYDPDGALMIEYEVMAGESHVGRASAAFPAPEGARPSAADVVDAVNAKVAPEIVGMNVFDRTSLEEVLARLATGKDGSGDGELPGAFAGILEASRRAAELIR